MCAFSVPGMRTGRALLAGLGWAGVLGGVALCVLIFLSAYLAFDGDRPDVRGRAPDVVRLPSVPAAKVPRVALGRPPRQPAGGGGRRRSGSRTGGGAARRAVPGTRTAPRAFLPGGTPQSPSGAAPRAPTAPAPAAGGGTAPASGGGGNGGGGGSRPGTQTLGDTTREVVQVIGTGVGEVSPPAEQVVNHVGAKVGDAVDGLPVAPRRPRPRLSP
jgi:hypothetical protein